MPSVFEETLGEKPDNPVSITREDARGGHSPCAVWADVPEGNGSRDDVDEADLVRTVEEGVGLAVTVPEGVVGADTPVVCDGVGIVLCVLFELGVEVCEGELDSAAEPEKDGDNVEEELEEMLDEIDDDPEMVRVGDRVRVLELDPVFDWLPVPVCEDEEVPVCEDDGVTVCVEVEVTEERAVSDDEDVEEMVWGVCV